MSANVPLARSTPESQQGGQGLPRLVLEARVRLGSDASPEQVANDVRAQGFPGVKLEEVRQLWDEGHLPVG